MNTLLYLDRCGLVLLPQLEEEELEQEQEEVQRAAVQAPQSVLEVEPGGPELRSHRQVCLFLST